MLKMKQQCEKCLGHVDENGIAFICSYECTFCQTCTDEMQAICPNCSGELVKRPTRIRKGSDEPIDLK